MNYLNLTCGFFLGISVSSFTGSYMVGQEKENNNCLYQKDKIELSCKDLNQNGKLEKILNIGNKKYLLNLENNNPTLSKYKLNIENIK